MNATWFCSNGGVQLVERVAHRQARAMKKNTHIALGNVEEGTDLRGIELLLTPQDQHRALRGRQRFDDRLDMLQDAASLDVPLGCQIFPKLGHAAPMAATVIRLSIVKG